MTRLNPSCGRPLLTFAIPTYNREKYLGPLLGVLLEQLSRENCVEVIVSDNASTDNTSAVVEGYRQQGLPVRYLRNEQNRGPDFNILQCYEQAAGKYVWIFGDDDLLLDGGLFSVLRILEQEELDFVVLATYAFRESLAEISPSKRNVPTQIIEDPIKLVSLSNLYADPIFITAGLINKERVSSLPHPLFSSLLGTNLVQLGWIFTALCHFRRGLFVQLGTIAARGGNSSGGFQPATVFGTNYRRAIDVWLGPSPKLAAKVLHDHMKIWFPRNWLGFRKNDADSRRSNAILSEAFSDDLWYWTCAYPIMRAPWHLARIWAKGLRLLLRVQTKRMSV